jgi:hypothetical protein
LRFLSQIKSLSSIESCRQGIPAVILYACIITILSLASCSTAQKQQPLPVNGVLDLRQWNFENDGNIELKGYWEFYYGDFLPSRKFDSLQKKIIAGCLESGKEVMYQVMIMIRFAKAS